MIRNPRAEKESAELSILYVSYFGLREPLVQRQVIPYLRELQQVGRVGLLTFEARGKSADDSKELDRAGKELAAIGIDWHWRRYHKWPSLPATIFDIVVGAATIGRLAWKRNYRFIHCRSHVPTLMGALVKAVLPRSVIVFDVRGFMPEEYVDAGVWPQNGFLFRLAKRVEGGLMGASDAFVVLTKRARRIMFPESNEAREGRPIEVIPCCVDTTIFGAPTAAARNESRRALGMENRLVLAHVGTLGGWYPVEMTARVLGRALRRKKAGFGLILTLSDPMSLERELRRQGLTPNDYLIARALPSEVPGWLAAADAGLSMVKPCFSKVSSSPTKVAEYLSLGLPIISTSGIGDLDDLLDQARVGVRVRQESDTGYDEALDQLEALREDPSLSERCRSVAREQFDLRAVGGPAYRRLYARLVATTPIGPVSHKAPAVGS